jgi:hypothetical protein
MNFSTVLVPGVLMLIRHVLSVLCLLHRKYHHLLQKDLSPRLVAVSSFEPTWLIQWLLINFLEFD